MRILAIALALIMAAAPAEAGPILDRIKAEKRVRCGGVARPGLFDVEDDGRAHGLELDLCRAVASVVLGPDGGLEFANYDSEKTLAAARDGHDDLMFLTGRELAENNLAGQVVPGPAVFFETTAVMVLANQTYRHLADLAGKPICFSLGEHAQFHLHAWFAARRFGISADGFQEDVEMNDAYKVGYCGGLAGEATTLAETSHSQDVGERGSRILPETLAAYPILAVSSTRDGEWAAIVAWTMETLKRADAPTSAWVRGGPESMPVEAPALGLQKGWQKKLIDFVGGYNALFDKNLGAGSDLKLERGVFAPPYVD